MNKTTLHVDRVACDGRGLCIELLPEVLAEDPWATRPIATVAATPSYRPVWLVRRGRPCGTVRAWR